jgi:hypothetical protein
MTLPYERNRSVIQAEQFLLDLCDPKKTPRVPKRIRAQARSLLRHYPTNYHMKEASEMAPSVFSSDW